MDLEEESIINNNNFLQNDIKYLTSSNSNNSELSTSDNLFSISCLRFKNNGKITSKLLNVISVSNTQFSICEKRILSDLNEIYKNDISTRKFDIIISDYQKYDSNSQVFNKKNANNVGFYDNYISFEVEFKLLFVLKFIFSYKFPMEPPKIIYVSGFKHSAIFDKNGEIKLESLKREKWTPVLTVRTLIFSIEMLISTSINFVPFSIENMRTMIKSQYKKKRKFCEYEQNCSTTSLQIINEAGILDINVNKLINDLKKVKISSKE